MGHDLTIYSRAGERKFNLFSRGVVCSVTKASLRQSLMSDDIVSLSVTSARPLDITIGDYITLFGRRYTVNQMPQPTKQGERAFSYEITLEGLQYTLLDILYTLPADAYGETYYANLQRHLDVLGWNVNRIHKGWAIQLDTAAFDAEHYENITSSGKNTLAMLQELCDLFSVEFEINAIPGTGGGTIHIKKKAGTTHPFTLQHGRGRGLYQISRNNVNNAGITNRLYVYGASENLPRNYNHTKLCLPETSRLTSYIENAASIETYGVKEGEKTYSEIKPERQGIITALGEDRISFIDASGDANDPANLPMFDLNEKKADGSTKYLIDGASAKIKFNTGNLAGYEFDLHSYDHETKKFTINRFTDESGLVIPNDTQDAFTFAVGDKYIITDIQLPDAYVKRAQARLKAAALADFESMTQPQVSYKLKLAEDFFIKFCGKNAVEVLRPGDFIHIIDEQIGVDKEVRITDITRDLLRPHSYEITLSDTVTKSSAVRIYNELNDIKETIGYNSGFADPGKARRRWMASQELYNMVFDTEGDYYSEKIKPLSIETQMLAVGAKSAQFTLNNVMIQPNYTGDPNAIAFSGGSLVHYGIDPDNPRTWSIAQNITDSLNATTPYFIYAKCPINGGAGAFILSPQPIKCESHAGWYHFLIGVLNSTNYDTHGGRPARLISLTYGASTINGRFIRCGRIESSGGGATYFDLDTGVICGKLKFISADGKTVKDITAIDAKNAEIEDYINNALPQILNGHQTQLDGKIEFYCQEEDPSADWTPTDLPAHTGDLWYKTSTKELKRFGNDHAWAMIQDAEAIAASAAASRAQDTADGKRRVFTDTPAPPYDKGDLWAQGATGDLMRCVTSRATGTYQADDWGKASRYTGDDALNNFIQNTYNKAMTEIANQLDGVIETHFGSGVPTLTNAPASEWTTTEDCEKHLGDLYYNNDSGIGYRFSKDGSTYKWVEVRDTGVTDALAAASRAQDTADGKRRVFTEIPTPPYDKGDLWASGTFLKRCIVNRAGGTYQEDDWDLATNYTGDESLDDFINGTFGDVVSEIYNQIDGKLESYYSNEDPATAWTTDEERNRHIGDQWYKLSAKTLWRYTRTSTGLYSWVEIQSAEAIAAAKAASNAQDTADGKRRIFITTPTITTPTPPYDPGDLWAQGASGEIMACITGRASGTFQKDDWIKASKYTDDSALTDFMTQYDTDQTELRNQIDGKIECFYTTTNPMQEWDEADYDRHTGDQWYYITVKKLYRLIRTAWHQSTMGDWVKPSIGTTVAPPVESAINHATYSWVEIQSAEAIAAAEAAARAQDTADGKRTVFVSEPKAPYYIGDLWLKDIDSDNKAAGGLWRCVKNCATAGSFNSADWVEATYYDATQTTIDGGIVTAGTVQLANEQTASICAGITGGRGKSYKETASTPASEKVRIWAGASEGNRKIAPFRVLENGKVYATNAEVEGTVKSSSGEIGGWQLHDGRLTSTEQDSEGNMITPAVELNAALGQIKAADSVVMDADGFSLMRDGYSMVKVANVSVGEYSDNLLRKSIDHTSSPAYHNQDSGAIYIPYVNSGFESNPYKQTVIPLGFFEKGSQITLDLCSINFYVPDNAIYPLATVNLTVNNGIRIRLLRDGVVIKTWDSQASFGGASNRSYKTLTLTPNYTHFVNAGEAGTYSLIIDSPGKWTWKVSNSGELEQFTITTTIRYKFLRGNYERTLMGYDGLVSTWNDGYLFLNGAAFVVKFGNFALKLDSKGIKKTSNGGANWSDI